jgi:hypothetical protein
MKFFLSIMLSGLLIGTAAATPAETELAVVISQQQTVDTTAMEERPLEQESHSSSESVDKDEPVEDGWEDNDFLLPETYLPSQHEDEILSI